MDQAVQPKTAADLSAYDDIPVGFTLCGDFVGYRKEKTKDGNRSFLFVTVDVGNGPDDRHEIVDGIEGLEDYMLLSKGDKIAFPVRLGARMNRGAAAVSIARVRARN